MTPRCGLILLTGGRGLRLGGPKHERPHPRGGTWGLHLVKVFRTVVPEGPIQILGAPLPDAPDLPRVEDPRQGPAVALRHWAASGPPPARCWWVVACDQTRWTPEAFAAWLEEAEPVEDAWAMVNREGHPQPLGGFLPAALQPLLAKSEARSLHGLMETLPVRELPGAAWRGEDIDTREALERFEGR